MCYLTRQKQKRKGILHEKLHEKNDSAFACPFAAVTDGSSVVNYLMLAAKACGVDSCWIAHEKELFELEEGKQLLKKWGLPETLCGVAAAALGYAACEQPVAAPRKSDYIKVI